MGSDKFMCTVIAAFLLLYAASAADSDQPGKEVLAELDTLFRKTYREARQELVSHAGPVILARGDRLTLLRDGKQVESTIISPEYSTLKTISHITLATFVLLEPYGEGLIAPTRLEQLEHLNRLALAAKGVVERELPDLKMAEQQQVLIDITRKFIDDLVAAKSWNRKRLYEFLEAVKPQILINMTAATKSRIDSFHRQVSAWRNHMSEEEWEQLHVVILGTAMPRKNNLAVQYFSKLLGRPGEGMKIIYAESIFSDKKALQLLGTSLLDTQISNGYFSDPWRMHRDLLGNAAAVYLDQLWLDRPNPQ
jgi:hypothetical protein